MGLEQHLGAGRFRFANPAKQRNRVSNDPFHDFFHCLPRPLRERGVQISDEPFQIKHGASHHKGCIVPDKDYLAIGTGRRLAPTRT